MEGGRWRRTVEAFFPWHGHKLRVFDGKTELSQRPPVRLLLRHKLLRKGHRAIRGLGKYILPPFRGPSVNIAEPKLVFKRFAIFRPLFPKICRHNRRVAPEAHGFLGVLLVLVDSAMALCFIQ